MEVCNVFVEQPDKFARNQVHDKPKSVITLYFKLSPPSYNLRVSVAILEKGES